MARRTRDRTAADDALRALILASRDVTPVCQRLPSSWWTGPADDEQRDAAVAGCGSCALLGLCEVFAELESPSGVVVAAAWWP